MIIHVFRPLLVARRLFMLPTSCGFTWCVSKDIPAVWCWIAVGWTCTQLFLDILRWQLDIDIIHIRTSRKCYGKLYLHAIRHKVWSKWQHRRHLAFCRLTTMVIPGFACPSTSPGTRGTMWNHVEPLRRSCSNSQKRNERTVIYHHLWKDFTFSDELLLSIWGWLICFVTRGSLWTRHVVENGKWWPSICSWTWLFCSTVWQCCQFSLVLIKGPGLANALAKRFRYIWVWS